MPVRFRIVCGCFQTTKTESSGRNRDCIAWKALKIYSLACYRKSWPTPGLELIRVTEPLESHQE